MVKIIKNNLVLILCCLLLTVTYCGNNKKQSINRKNIFGNPEYEKLVQVVDVPKFNIKFRLYKGNSHATVAFWYSITKKNSNDDIEYQIFAAYNSPIVNKIIPGEEGVTLKGPNFSFKINYVEVDNLINSPIIYYRGVLKKELD